MDRLEAIKQRTLSKHDQAVIQGMAGGKSESGIENQMPAPELKPEKRPDINEVEFYGAKVMGFYEHFSYKSSQSTAATLTLAAATLKASVVLGGLIKDLTEAIKPATVAAPAIPAKLSAPAIPGKRKRGRPRKNAG